MKVFPLVFYNPAWRVVRLTLPGYITHNAGLYNSPVWVMKPGLDDKKTPYGKKRIAVRSVIK